MSKINRFFESLDKGIERALPVLNGVIGDMLEEKMNRLSIKMELYNDDTPLSLTKKTAGQLEWPDKATICILAHGSCSSERHWGFKDDPSASYGSLLKKEMGYFPLYLRYNSGLHISTNGRRFSALLEKLLRLHPGKIGTIILIGHSMGGLLFRSACHYGKKDKRKWPGLVSKIFYLGAPHLGTHLEKAGKLATSILGQIPNPTTRIIAALGNLRSAGIKDLRHGYVTDDDWQKKTDNFFHAYQNKIPLLEKAEHYMICSTLSKNAASKMGRLFGDGMVHPASGTGRRLFASDRIPLPEDHCRIIPGLAHHKLQKDRRVYEQIKIWCHEEKRRTHFPETSSQTT